MDYKKLIKKIDSELNLNLTEVNINNLIKMIQEEYEENISISVHGIKKDKNALLEAAKPLMKYLCENYHPHVTVIVNGTSAQLVEELKLVTYNNYIQD
jgi:hypothetical protein